MIARLSKPQWFLVILADAIAMLINGIGVSLEWQRYEAWPRDPLYSCENPWLKVVPGMILATLLLLAFAWLAVLASRGRFIQRLPLAIRYGAELLVALLAGFVIAVASTAFSDAWAWEFHCGPMLGLLYSWFVRYWALRGIWPAATALLFWAMCLSNRPAPISSPAAVTD